jgi:hypothetical protein
MQISHLSLEVYVDLARVLKNACIVHVMYVVSFLVKIPRLMIIENDKRLIEIFYIYEVACLRIK